MEYFLVPIGLAQLESQKAALNERLKAKDVSPPFDFFIIGGEIKELPRQLSLDPQSCIIHSLVSGGARVWQFDSPESSPECENEDISFSYSKNNVQLMEI
jgi:hypothetical protein